MAPAWRAVSRAPQRITENNDVTQKRHTITTPAPALRFQGDGRRGFMSDNVAVCERLSEVTGVLIPQSKHR